MRNDKRQVVSTDAEIALNNRLALMVEIHSRRQQPKITTSNHVEKQEREQKMGKETGTCEQCGKPDARLTKHFNKEVCPSCTAMRGFVKNKPAFVVDAMQEFHGSAYLASPFDESNINAPGGYIDGLEQAYAIERARCSRLPLLEAIFDQMQGVIDCLYPGLDMQDDNDVWSAMETVNAKVCEMHANLERLTQKAVTVAGIRNSLNIDMAVPDDQVPGILHDTLQPCSVGQDKMFVSEIASHLGMVDTPTTAEVIEGVAGLVMAFDHVSRSCDHLLAQNSKLREQVNQLTYDMTTTSIVDQVEAAVSKDAPLLDLALAALRGDTIVVADKLELMRGPLA